MGSVLAYHEWSTCSIYFCTNHRLSMVINSVNNLIFSIKHGVFGPNYIEINIVVRKNIIIFIALQFHSIAADIGNIGICICQLEKFWDLKEFFCLHFGRTFDICRIHHHKKSLQYYRVAKELYKTAILVMIAYNPYKVSPKLQKITILFAHPNIAILIEIWLDVEKLISLP